MLSDCIGPISFVNFKNVPHVGENVRIHPHAECSMTLITTAPLLLENDLLGCFFH